MFKQVAILYLSVRGDHRAQSVRVRLDLPGMAHIRNKKESQTQIIMAENLHITKADQILSFAILHSLPWLRMNRGCLEVRSCPWVLVGLPRRPSPWRPCPRWIRLALGVPSRPSGPLLPGVNHTEKGYKESRLWRLRDEKQTN